MVIWSINNHDAPLHDLTNLLSPLGVKFINRNVSPRHNCKHFNGCNASQSLKVINYKITYDHCFATERYLVQSFYEAYRDDPEMKSVDAFICYDTAVICSLYEPFNKSLIIIPTARYNHWTCTEPETWRPFNEKIRRYAADQRNVIAANNLYDVEYTHWFTGIRGRYLPSFCNYSGTTYIRTRPTEYLIWRRARYPRAGLQPRFIDEFGNATKALDGRVRLIEVTIAYPNGYSMIDIASYAGIVHIPYQTSTMSVFEQYRMNIPLFFPSRELLVDWHMNYAVICCRGRQQFPCNYGEKVPKNKMQTGSPIERFAGVEVPDPNDDVTRSAVDYWLALSDFFTFPHITYFNSSDHLAQLLDGMRPGDLQRISAKMREFNRSVKRDLLMEWKGILHRIARYSINNPR